MNNIYPKYKPSGIEWIVEVPEHWNVKKLKYIALVQPSNVDKKTNEGEQDVLLCNYVDVYKNEFIDDSINFMEATANENEVEKFRLQNGDVLITKDSETPQEIAIPAYVKIEKPNLLCGYHLAQIRSFPYVLYGEYLFRLFQAKDFNINFEIAANGITRYGLGIDAVKDVGVILPPLSEQTAIAAYLDDKTAQIDSLISKKQKMIELLKEELIAEINHTVTKGLNPDVKMKDSGVEWIGDIPVHWDIARITNVCKIFGRIGYRGYTISDIVQEGEGVVSLSPSNILGQVIVHKEDTYITWEKYFESPEIQIFPDDIVLVKTGSTIGKVAIIPPGEPEMTLNPQLVVLKNILQYPKFLYYIMTASYFQSYFDIYTAGGSTPAISQEKINNFRIVFPASVSEQTSISNYLDDKTTEFDLTIKKIGSEIELLQQYRTALISEVVSGKICVT